MTTTTTSDGKWGKINVSSHFSPLSWCDACESKRVCVCVCKEVALLGEGREEYTQKPPTISEEPPKSLTTSTESGYQSSSKNIFSFYMIINLLLFLTFRQQQHHHRTLSSASPPVSAFLERKTSQNIFCLSRRLFSVRMRFSSGVVCRFSRLMIIKCTTSGSWRIISHLTPHAIGRRAKTQEN
jgi:hypothetical protein